MGKKRKSHRIFFGFSISSFPYFSHIRPMLQDKNLKFGTRVHHIKANNFLTYRIKKQRGKNFFLTSIIDFKFDFESILL